MTPDFKAKLILDYYRRIYGLVRPPASEQIILAVEDKLGCRLPPTLRALYNLCDGIQYPEGDMPLFWVQMIPEQTVEFRGVAPDGKGEKYSCCGWEEGKRYLAIEIEGAEGVIYWDPTLRVDFESLGPDLLSAYKNLEKSHRQGLKEEVFPDK